MNTLPSYYDLLKENALLRLEIAEAMRILHDASLVNVEGQEVVTSLVSHAQGIVDILAAEMEHIKDLENELGHGNPEPDKRQLDLFDNEQNISCGDCGKPLTLVRPGNHQCDYCESMSACHQYGLCSQNCFPTFNATCNICPLKGKA